MLCKKNTHIKNNESIFLALCPRWVQRRLCGKFPSLTRCGNCEIKTHHVSATDHTEIARRGLMSHPLHLTSLRSLEAGLGGRPAQENGARPSKAPAGTTLVFVLEVWHAQVPGVTGRPCILWFIVLFFSFQIPCLKNSITLLPMWLNEEPQNILSHNLVFKVGVR